MIELKGSEKQIAWAEDIRKKFITEIANASKEACMETSDYPEDVDYALFKKIINTILNQSSSKWWIKHINLKILNLEDFVMLAEGDDEKENWNDFIHAYAIRERG